MCFHRQSERIQLSQELVLEKERIESMLQQMEASKSAEARKMQARVDAQAKELQALESSLLNLKSKVSEVETNRFEGHSGREASRHNLKSIMRAACSAGKRKGSSTCRS